MGYFIITYFFATTPMLDITSISSQTFNSFMSTSGNNEHYQSNDSGPKLMIYLFLCERSLLEGFPHPFQWINLQCSADVQSNPAMQSDFTHF